MKLHWGPANMAGHFVGKPVGWFVDVCCGIPQTNTTHLIVSYIFLYNIMVENTRYHQFGWVVPHCLMAHPSNNGENDDNPWWPLV